MYKPGDLAFVGVAKLVVGKEVSRPPPLLDG